MKIYFAIVFSLLATSLTAQSLKDSLFSGKLKNPLKKEEMANDSVRKIVRDSIAAITPPQKDPSAPTVVNTPVTGNATSNPGEKPAEMLPDSLNRTYYAKQKAWKRFIDQQTMIITAQANDSRKVRKGEYYIEFDYEIGLNGRVKATNITCSPENDFIKATVTDILSRPPVLAPPIYSDGKPRAVTAKQQITILKK